MRRVFLMTLLALGHAAVVWATSERAGKIRIDITDLASPNPHVREAAERAFLEQGAEAVGPVLEVAAKGEPGVADAARRLLPRFGPGAIDALITAGRRDLGGADETRWRTAVGAAAAMGQAALPRIMSIFQEGNPYGSNWFFAASVLRSMGPLAVEALIPLLDHPKKEVRQEAAEILAGAKDRRTKEAFVRGLQHEDVVIRSYSARALGDIGEDDVSDRLLQILDDPGWGPRRAAASALGKMYQPSYRDRMARLARRDPAVEVRQTASNVLIYRSREPIGVRLGRRYAPDAISPVEELREQIRYLVLPMGTFTLLLVCCLVGSSYGTPVWGARAWFLLGVCGAVAGGAGWWWGFVVEKVTGHLEIAVLTAAGPSSAIFGVMIGWPARRRLRLGFFLVAWVIPLAAFYTAYWLGWLKLWGRL